VDGADSQQVMGHPMESRTLPVRRSTRSLRLSLSINQTMGKVTGSMGKGREEAKLPGLTAAG